MMDKINKTLNENPLWIMLFSGIILGLIIGMVIALAVEPFRFSKQPNIDLPEEYKLITPSDQLQGKYDKSTNTLHLWFNNKPTDEEQAGYLLFITDNSIELRDKETNRLVYTEPFTMDSITNSRITNAILKDNQ